ncbi:MAG: hypothetical protein EAZ13_03010 [Sphingobacteriia bacterium]|nr:MAG: hypothetical protein EAZ13_03010 [Sphingobacteriia bacterium]
MKKIFILSCIILIGFSSCKLLGIGKKSSPKEVKQDGGCPTDGKNVGAEKLLSDNPKIKKAPKYTKGKALSYQ